MPDWQETHFGIPKKTTARPRRRWWPFVIAIPVLTVAGAIVADRQGYITLPDWWRRSAGDIPLVGPSLVPQQAANGNSAGRERQLRERVSSQERGISLMSRERVGVLDELVIQQRLLDDATRRLRSIEATSTGGMSPAQLDNLRIAHADAVAAAKNATLRVRQLSDRRDSLNRRITTAQKERDAALTELGLAPATTEETVKAP
jgi:hypothetical protein